VPTEWRLSTQAGAVQRVENGGYVASPSKAAKTFKNALRSQTRPAAPVPPGALTQGTGPPGHRSHTDSEPASDFGSSLPSGQLGGPIEDDGNGPGADWLKRVPRFDEKKPLTIGRGIVLID